VVDLECMKREIEALVGAKGFYNSPEDVPKRFFSPKFLLVVFSYAVKSFAIWSYSVIPNVACCVSEHAETYGL